MSDGSATIGEPKIDIHVHLAGVGTQGSGCWISPSLRRRPTFIALRLLLGIAERQMRTTVDQDWAALISDLVDRSNLDLAVVLGFDGVYDSRGVLDYALSQLIVPQGWVFEVCRRYRNLLPAPSINPYRRDAMDRLEEAIEQGATMLKWLPIVQAFDPGSPRVEPFLRRIAEAGLPVLVHAGSGEVTLRTIDPTVGGLDRLVPALEMGVRVICAHTAAPIHYSRQPSALPLLRSLLQRYANLWVDNSGLANFSRFAHLPAFAAEPLVRDRTIHGSDYPVPATSAFYIGRIGATAVATTERITNPFQKEMDIKRRIGFPEASFTRAASVLANLGRWYATPSASGVAP